jgi:hypothetical protein
VNKKENCKTMGPTKRKNNNRQEIRQLSLTKATPRSQRINRRRIELEQHNNDQHDISTRTKQQNESSEDSDNNSVSDLNHSVAKKSSYAKQTRKSVANIDNCSDDSIYIEDQDLQMNHNSKELPLSFETQDNETSQYQIEGSKNRIQDFEACLGQSVMFNKMMDSQKLIFEKLEQISTQQIEQSGFSVNKSITVVKLSDEQKSTISNYIQNKFSTIKFLRDDEWQLWEQQLLVPIFLQISINNEEVKNAMINVVKNFSTQCINQKRAETIRSLKRAVRGKYLLLIFH